MDTVLDDLLNGITGPCGDLTGDEYIDCILGPPRQPTRQGAGSTSGNQGAGGNSPSGPGGTGTGNRIPTGTSTGEPRRICDRSSCPDILDRIEKIIKQHTTWEKIKQEAIGKGIGFVLKKIVGGIASDVIVKVFTPSPLAPGTCGPGRCGQPPALPEPPCIPSPQTPRCNPGPNRP